MIRIITLLGLLFFTAACNDAPEKEAEPETPQTPADDLATAKADAQAKIAVATALLDDAGSNPKHVSAVDYDAAVGAAKAAAGLLTAALPAAADVNKIKADTQELERLITIATSMTKNSANIPDAVAQANKTIADANKFDIATVAAGAGHDEIVTKINNIKKSAATDPKSVGQLTAAVTAANTAGGNAGVLDTATEVLRKRIIKISNLIAERKAAIAAAQVQITKANGFANTAPGVYVDDARYAKKVKNAKTDKADSAANLSALIANNASPVADVEAMTTDLKALIDAIEAVGTIAKQAAAMKLYTDLGADLTAATVTNANLTAALTALNGLNTNEKAHAANAATNAIAAIQAEQTRRAAIVAALIIANGYTTTQITNARALLDTTNDAGDNGNGTAFTNPASAKAARDLYRAAIEAAEGAVATAINAINAAATDLAAAGLVDGGSTLDVAIKTTLANATAVFQAAITKAA